MIVWVIALAWAAVAMYGVLALADHRAVVRRTRAVRVRSRRRPRRRRRSVPLPRAVSHWWWVLGGPFRRRRRRRHEDRLRSELPIGVDLVAVAVGAGCTPFQAVELAQRWSPKLVAGVLHGIARATALGASFDDALRDTGSGTPIVRPLTDVLRTSAALGSPASASLGRLALDVRADVRRRAEAHARTIPVRLLFPLVFCILPAFALLTVVPLFAGGLPIG
ncbi:MAG TPA: type II secretion system F family protein [Acidimicrobiia bacterium]|nr:type II secretion system F family protein [Acidimicrobiia bacterium]